MIHIHVKIIENIDDLRIFQTSVVGIDLNFDVIADAIKYTDLLVMSGRKNRLRLFICDLQGFPFFFFAFQDDSFFN